VLGQHRQGVGVAEDRDLERVPGGRPALEPHQLALPRDEHLTGLQLAAGANQCLPPATLGVTRFQQQHLDRTPGRALHGEPRRDHLRIVDDEEVAVTEQLHQIADVTVLRGDTGAAIDEQPGGVARLDRMLGDQLRRQRVIEVGELHDGCGTLGP
jgi:hypothetical protein